MAEDKYTQANQYLGQALGDAVQMKQQQIQQKLAQAKQQFETLQGQFKDFMSVAANDKMPPALRMTNYNRAAAISKVLTPGNALPGIDTWDKSTDDAMKAVGYEWSQFKDGKQDFQTTLKNANGHIGDIMQSQMVDPNQMMGLLKTNTEMAAQSKLGTVTSNGTDITVNQSPFGTTPLAGSDGQPITTPNTGSMNALTSQQNANTEQARLGLDKQRLGIQQQQNEREAALQQARIHDANINRLQSALTALDKNEPGVLENLFNGGFGAAAATISNNLKEQGNRNTIRKALADKLAQETLQLKLHEGQNGLQPAIDPLDDQATQILAKAKKPLTPANLAYVKQQLQGSKGK